MKMAVYGASGYTGRLVLAELARRDIPAVLVGRDPERLRAAAAAAGTPDAETAQPASMRPAEQPDRAPGGRAGGARQRACHRP